MRTHNTPLLIKKKLARNIPNTIMSAVMGFFCLLGTQERVRNSRGKRAISVRAIEVLLSTVWRDCL